MIKEMKYHFAVLYGVPDFDDYRRLEKSFFMSLLSGRRGLTTYQHDDNTFTVIYGDDALLIRFENDTLSSISFDNIPKSIIEEVDVALKNHDIMRCLIIKSGNQRGDTVFPVDPTSPELVERNQRDVLYSMMKYRYSI